MIDKPRVEIYVNRITFKIKLEYPEPWTPENMKLLGSTDEKITKDENGEIVLHLENIEVVLVRFNMVNNKYKRDWVLSTFVQNKSFGQLLNTNESYLHRNISFKVFIL